MKALEIINLKKTYNNKYEALKGISFNVEKGDFFALLGPNGAGKSTTIGIITSLVNKTSGIVNVFGKDLDIEKNEVKKLIGVVPQEFNFNIFTPIYEIILNQAGYYGISKKEALSRTDMLLKEFDLLNKKYSKAMELSGGMKRRLMIARALIHNPKILILDEPTAGVDIEIRRSMWTYLKKLNKLGTTIILTTHYLEEAENLCNKIAIIDKGKIIENTTIKNILSKLQNEIFVLDIKGKLTNIPNKNNMFKMKLINENTIEVLIEKEKDLNCLFTFLNENNIKVLSMRNKTNRLEELFIELIDNKNIKLRKV